MEDWSNLFIVGTEVERLRIPGGGPWAAWGTGGISRLNFCGTPSGWELPTVTGGVAERLGLCCTGDVDRIAVRGTVTAGTAAVRGTVTAGTAAFMVTENR